MSQLYFETIEQMIDYCKRGNYQGSDASLKQMLSMLEESKNRGFDLRDNSRMGETVMTPKLAVGHKFFKEGMLWEVRDVDVRTDGIYYSAVPYEANAKNLNFRIIVVRESEINI